MSVSNLIKKGRAEKWREEEKKAFKLLGDIIRVKKSGEKKK